VDFFGPDLQNETTRRKVGSWRIPLYSSLTLYTRTWKTYVKAHRYRSRKMWRCPTWLQCSFPKILPLRNTEKCETVMDSV